MYIEPRIDIKLITVVNTQDKHRIVVDL